VCRIKNTAKITMVKNIFNCSCLVVDGIFVPNSYIDLSYLYGVLRFSNW
jgi:hypothetical protein